jgi:hypothetical protein
MQTHSSPLGEWPAEPCLPGQGAGTHKRVTKLLFGYPATGLGSHADPLPDKTGMAFPPSVISGLENSAAVGDIKGHPDFRRPCRFSPKAPPAIRKIRGVFYLGVFT